MTTNPWGTATAVLRLSTELVEGVQTGLAQRGFTDVRPAHGFAFVRLSEGPATTVQLADHLGISKQAASELVGYLIDRGYLSKMPDPTDQRAKLLVLTDRGGACTRAAQEAAVEVVEGWQTKITDRQQVALDDILQLIRSPGRLRPTW